MMILELALRFEASLQQPSAWLLIGNEPTEWLAAATTFSNQASLRLLPLPISAKDRGVYGALLISNSGSLPTKPSVSAIGYFQATPRLFLPCNAKLEPPTVEAELVKQLASDRWYVWHPTIGLIGIEETEALQLSSLLTFGPRKNRSWDQAQAGVMLAPRLMSLKPEETPGSILIFEASRSDIGSQGNDLLKLPPSDEEPNQGVAGKSKRAAEKALASAVRWLTDRAPKTSAKRTWVNGIDDWARQKLDSVRSDLSAIRHKEVLRLMKLLENDPDQGLKFALPLNSNGGRGVASPSDRLGPRDINFNLSRLGGGDAVDAWDLDNDYRMQLSARYRELANRELQLGRYRRAAYIFGELLGDLHAAANALKQGQHFREAAVLYEERLNLPLEAARCLEQGCLWSEAIELYLELKEFEIAGDLYAKLKQPELAEQQFRNALREERRRNLLLNSARILREKLNSEVEALQDLANGWPDSSQAVDCAKELFVRYAELGMHVEAEQRMQAFAGQTMSSHRILDLVDILAAKATRYPDQNVRRCAANITREIVSQQLKKGSSSNCKRLLEAIASLTPDDRLLRRDCQRFETQSRVRVKPPKKKPPASSPVRSFRVGTQTKFYIAAGDQQSLFMAGFSESAVSLIQTDWENLDQSSVRWLNRIQADSDGWSLAVARDKNRSAILNLHNQDPLEPKTLRRIFGSESGTRVNYFGYRSHQLLATAPRRSGGFWLLENDERDVHLIAVTATGEMISSHTMSLVDVLQLLGHAPTSKYEMLEHREQIFISGRDQLFCVEKGENVDTMHFDQPIRELAISQELQHPRLAIGFEEGAMLLSNGLENDPLPFAQDLYFPKVCVHPGGFIIAADKETCRVYQFQDLKLQLKFETRHNKRKPIAVLPTGKENQFAICFESGDVLVYALA